MTTMCRVRSFTQVLALLAFLALSFAGCGDGNIAGGRGGDDATLDSESDLTDVSPDPGDDPVPDSAEVGDGGGDLAIDNGSDLGVDAADDLGADTADDTDTTDGGTGCATTLCGPASVCCPEATECVLDSCLAACATGVRCGEDLTTCCPDDSVCQEGACTPIGAGCVDSYDCPEGEFCEPTLDRCLPQPTELSCQVVPEFEEVTVEVEWSDQTIEVISIPLVGDLDGDTLPEVVVNVARVGDNDWPIGEIAIYSGEDGTLVRRLTHDPGAEPPVYGSHGRTTAAIGDVTGDGLPDIIYAGRQESGSRGPIHAVTGAGDYLWTAHDESGEPVLFTVVNGAASVANFDDDPMAEIVFGASLIDHNGLVVWDEDDNGAPFGSNSGYVGGISAIADIDGDDYPEIISGRDAWKVSWTPGETAEDPPTVSVDNEWSHGVAGNDGYPAVADLDGNGTPEVVLVSGRTVRVLETVEGQLWCGRDPTGTACADNDELRTQPLFLEGETTSNRGGPPTIADFDGDGLPEIGIAGGWSYTVYDVNRPDEEIVQPEGRDPPEPGAIFVRWFSPTHDFSSNASGSSVFDFQGDGAAEVIYADECFMRVYSGTDGDIQLEIMNSNGTIHEYPLVVDIDGDNNSELVIVANVTNSGTNCGEIEDYEARQGLFVYGGPDDDWVRTRRVWTQHGYHVTNATSNGNVPSLESNNWELDGLNNYRQNVQGEGVFNAPDLRVELAAAITGCDEEVLTLQARVSNQGTLGVPAGVEVTFYLGADAGGALLATEYTTRNLLPGSSEVVVAEVPAPPANELVDYFVAVDGDEAGAGIECDADNNGDPLEWAIGCPKD